MSTQLGHKRFLTPAVCAALALWLSGVACVLCCNLLCIGGERAESDPGFEVAGIVSPMEQPEATHESHSCCDAVAETAPSTESSIAAVSSANRPACCPLMKAGHNAGYLSSVPQVQPAAPVDSPAVAPRAVLTPTQRAPLSRTVKQRDKTYLRCCVFLI